MNDVRREITRAFGVPDHIAGIPTPWYRGLIQRITRRPGHGR